MKFHHIGIASDDIEKSLNYLYSIVKIDHVSETIYDQLQDATLCMVTLEDGTMLEIISGNVVKSFIKKRRFLYHICYETENFESDMKLMIQQGGFLISDAKPAILFHNRNVCFIETQLGLIELLESEKE